MSVPAHGSYGDVVVGAGPAGLTAALLLARLGRSVLLVERAPHTGGGLRRFRRCGTAFDTGFHFTGSVRPGELFDHLLRTLGVRDAIVLRPYDDARAHRFIFRREEAEVDVPNGIAAARACWRERFPADAAAVDWYFEALESIAGRTMGMSVGRALTPAGMLDEDFMSLRAVLDERFTSPVLKGTISGFAMCHGAAPAEVSFAAHARVAYGLHQSVGALAGGGDALADALTAAARAAGVEICHNCALEGIEPDATGMAGQALFAGGRRARFERCLLTIHPQQMLELLAPLKPTPAFRQRVADFAPAIGFFVSFGELGGGAPPGFGGSIVSEFPSADFDAMMTPHYEGERPLVLVEVAGDAAAGGRHTLSALEMSFPEDVRPWADSRVGRRPEGYAAYKRQRVEAIARRLRRLVPYVEEIRWAEAASMLTFRDYLHSPHGSAYGIRQKIGQYGLFGRLPGRNVYAAGQSALLPGVLGAMMSGLFVVRQMAGKEEFDRRFGYMA